MNTQSWWQRLLNNRITAARRKPANRSTRLMEVELLEDRLVPTANIGPVNIYVVGATAVAAHQEVFNDPTRFNDGAATPTLTELDAHDYLAVNLRSAVADANQFPSSAAGNNIIWLETNTYHLNNAYGGSGSLNINLSSMFLTIKNMNNATPAGTNYSIIDAGNQSRIFNVSGGEGAATLDHLQLQHGTVTGFAEGGAIYNQGNLILNYDKITNNSATGYGGAGDIGAGGGVFQASGTLAINNSTFDSNTASGSSVSNPSSGAGAEGGGLCISFGSGAVSITASTFSNNQAIGGANSYGGGSGTGGEALGGALDISNTEATVTIVNSTFAKNTAQGGNGYGGGGDAYGGAIFVNSSFANLNLVNDTIALNCAKGGTTTGGNAYGGQAYGAGIAHNSGGLNVTAVNTIIALNKIQIDGTGVPTENLAGSDVSGAFLSKGHDLVGNIDGSTGFPGSGDIVGHTNALVSPGLDPLGLQNNGGPTLTIALIAGSQAIDHGDNSFVVPGETDQRGLPRISGPAVDIGAFEFQVPPPAPKKGRSGLGLFVPH